ncbi:DUF2812 domain-containing protein [Bacillus dakarensis]|uniref:DUF2812 domain-containing protein n=1 Tax=Robertmurraya dakarensis TaxID=1926278 RepID=UPI000980B5A9|nr:DUF2812 domain-containing protein [Bacillus dakarensis]
MKKTKYIPSGGLAFTEEKDMKILAQYAKKGWMVERFTNFGYKLVVGEPKNIDYSLDYQKGADEEYFLFFEEAGWSHVCSIGDEIHLFCATAGTKPIYTDTPTTIEKYEREKKQMGKSALPLLISTIVFLFLSNIDWGFELAGVVMWILGTLSLVLLIFPGLPYLGYQYKLMKLKKGSLH